MVCLYIAIRRTIRLIDLSLARARMEGKLPEEKVHQSW